MDIKTGTLWGLVLGVVLGAVILFIGWDSVADWGFGLVWLIFTALGGLILGFLVSFLIFISKEIVTKLAWSFSAFVGLVYSLIPLVSSALWLLIGPVIIAILAGIGYISENSKRWTEAALETVAPFCISGSLLGFYVWLFEWVLGRFGIHFVYLDIPQKIVSNIF